MVMILMNVTNILDLLETVGEDKVNFALSAFFVLKIRK